MKPRILVLRTAGTNCDDETVWAFTQAGGAPERVHIARVTERPSILADYRVLCLPGGFSYGDDLSAGKIVANQLAVFLQQEILRFVDGGGLVIGICNGFQALVKAGILPGLSRPWKAEATLAANDSGRFEGRWVGLECPPSACVFTKGMTRLELPVAHGEGKFVPADASVLARMKENRQVAIRYAGTEYPDNPNGSTDGIAGVCDPTGRILGMMPHPERHVARVQHPAAQARRWAGDGGADPFAPAEGLQVFRNAVDTVR